MANEIDLLIKNIGVLATPIGSVAKYGKEQNEIMVLKNAYIAVNNGEILEVGTGNCGFENVATQVIDASGCLVTPGLVDSHTHLVFGGWRQHEMSLKLCGASYLDILKAGGGILSTVERTREATEDELFYKSKALLETMLAHGTTTCEIKSGYGLNFDDELKQLNVTARLKKETPLDIASTFMGAHAVPKEFKENRDGYIDLLCNKIIPELATHKLAEFCDIFCESSVFDINETQRILETAASHGMKIKMHADEIEPMGGAELAGKLSAISAEHLIQASNQGIQAMAKSKTIAVLLPATSFYLDKPYARARKMLDENMAVAVATDFNPGSSPNLNLQLPMNIACLKYKLTPSEVLTAVTLNAAAAIGFEKKLGSLEPKKQADIVIWNCEDLDFLFYRYGNNQVKQVIKAGKVM